MGGEWAMGIHLTGFTTTFDEVHCCVYDCCADGGCCCAEQAVGRALVLPRNQLPVVHCGATRPSTRCGNTPHTCGRRRRSWGLIWTRLRHWVWASVQVHLWGQRGEREDRDDGACPDVCVARTRTQLRVKLYRLLLRSLRVPAAQPGPPSGDRGQRVYRALARHARGSHLVRRVPLADHCCCPCRHAGQGVDCRWCGV